MSSLRPPREGYYSSSFRRNHHIPDDDEEVQPKLPPSREFGIDRHQKHGAENTARSYYGHNNKDNDDSEYIKATEREQREKAKNGLRLASGSFPAVERKLAPICATKYDMTIEEQQPSQGRKKTSGLTLASASAPPSSNEIDARADFNPRTTIHHPGPVAVDNEATSNDSHTSADVENPTGGEVQGHEAGNNDGDATAVESEVVDVYDGTKIPDIPKYKTWQVICIAFVVFIIIGAGAGVVAGLLLRDDGGNGGNDTNDLNNPSSSPPATTLSPSGSPTDVESVSPTTSPSQEPVPTQEPFSEEFEELWSLIGNDITINGDLIRSDTDSVQHEAFMWLVDENQVNMFGSVELLQRYVAVLFYIVTGGTDWTYQLNFLDSTSSVCQWNGGVGGGFFCSGGNVYVDEIGIVNNNMAGILPDELGLLEDMIQIVVTENENLSGTIPSQVFSLTSLTALHLGFNSLTGTISTEVGQLRALWLLSVSDNYLTGTIPTELSLSTNLEVLQVSENILEGTLPTELGLITKLTFLDGSDNDFTGSIPSALGNLSMLENLVLAGLPTLTGTIPSELSRLIDLEQLILVQNQLTGTIPTEFGRLDKMEMLLLGEMPGLTGTIPTELGLLTDLEIFFLVVTQLTGTIPMEFGGLVKLLQLAIAGIPSLTGNIPTEFGLMMDLSALLLYDTRLTGTVPTEFANLTRLTIFGAYNSEITGSVDDMFCYPNNPFTFQNLELDCLGDPPEIECSCCTTCFL